MKYERLVEALRGINHRIENEMNPFVTNILDEARESPRAAVDIWIGPDAMISEKAAYLLIDMDDLAIVPLLESSKRLTSTQRAWLLRAIVDAELRLRDMIVARIDEMLDDKNPVLLKDHGGHTEEPPPPMRVCDEAYVQMRRLINIAEDEEAYYKNADAFLGLTDDEKDVEITNARELRIWTKFFEASDI